MQDLDRNETVASTCQFHILSPKDAALVPTQWTASLFYTTHGGEKVVYEEEQNSLFTANILSEF